KDDVGNVTVLLSSGKDDVGNVVVLLSSGQCSSLPVPLDQTHSAHYEVLHELHQELEHKVISLVKKELKKFKSLGVQITQHALRERWRMRRIRAVPEGGAEDHTAVLRNMNQTDLLTHYRPIKHKDRKYHGNTDTDPQQTKKTILALGKLAFQQLEKGNLIFYEEDLRECGIDVKVVSVYSGVCTQIFREEFGLHLGKVFSFVHLSIQEFLAALYAFLSFISKKKNVLKQQKKVQEVQTYLSRGGDHCLHGASLSPAQWSALVFVLLNSKEELDEFDLSKYDPSEECLLRLLPVVTASRKAVLDKCSITDEGCAALASALRSNPSSHLRELNLNFNKPGDSGVKQLSTLLEDPHCKVEKLDSGSNPSSHLRELNLSLNKPRDSGVKQLSALLEDLHCKLEKLQLDNCSITDEGCAALASALRSNPSSYLRELNLNHNKPGDSGVKQLSALQKEPNCKMEKLQLDNCSISEEGCAALASALRSNPSSHLRELNLNYNKPGHSGVKQLSALLKDPHCKLEKLQLVNCSITEKSCAALASALRSNPSSHLRELNLNYNKPGDSGVKQLSALLKDPHCKLEKLQVYNCSITDDGYAALSSALRSNRSSHLRELNLNSNKSGDSGVKQLSALLKDPHCKLEKL
ncbi:hypothetical protein P4O66_019093, partial [Electrophorus voltai]